MTAGAVGALAIEIILLKRNQRLTQALQPGAFGDRLMAADMRGDQHRALERFGAEQRLIGAGEHFGGARGHLVAKFLRRAAGVRAIGDQGRIDPRQAAECAQAMVEVKILGELAFDATKPTGRGDRIGTDHHRRPDQGIADADQPLDQRRGRVGRQHRRLHAVAVEHLGTGRDQHRPRIVVEIRDLPGEAIGVAQVILIQRRQIPAAGQLGAAIARTHDAAVLRHAHDAQARVGHAGQHIGAVVRRAIVDRQHLEMREALRPQAVERLADQRRAVIDRDDDRNDGIGHAAASACAPSS